MDRAGVTSGSAARSVIRPTWIGVLGVEENWPADLWRFFRRNLPPPMNHEDHPELERCAELIRSGEMIYERYTFPDGRHVFLCRRMQLDGKALPWHLDPRKVPEGLW